MRSIPLGRVALAATNTNTTCSLEHARNGNANPTEIGTDGSTNVTAWGFNRQEPVSVRLFSGLRGAESQSREEWAQQGIIAPDGTLNYQLKMPAGTPPGQYILQIEGLYYGRSA